jgi:hypothetical protein
MSIANYSTKVDTKKTVNEIMGMLSTHGATEITTIVRGRVFEGMTFAVITEYGPRTFSLPIRVNGVSEAMLADHSVPRSLLGEKQASRVAWRIARDWLRSQLALIDAGLAALDEVMLPYMLADSGKTMYELMKNQQTAITKGEES